MRIYPQGRWQRRLWWTALVVLAVVAFCVYLIATRSPINIRTWVRLSEDMQHREISRAEVEERLGGPPIHTRILDPTRKVGERMPFLSVDQMIPGTLTSYSGRVIDASPNVGDLTPATLEMLPTLRKGRTIVEVAIWDGREGRMIVSFDDEARTAGVRFQERLTWRSKLREWIPWLP
jgi:hypothetical protein